jgi:hypothetical protein
MSIKSSIVTAVTALTLVTGAGAAGTLAANAATPKCGQLCSDFYSRAFGTGSVLDVLDQAGQAGRLTILSRASRASQGEDFSVDGLGRVHDFSAAGIVPSGLNALYGGLFAYEIEYTPGASPTGLCLGVAATPGAGTPVTLQRCGMNARTIWIFDPEQTSSGTYYALISAATNRSFQHPFSLTALAPGFPLLTAQLVSAPGSLLSHQLWSAEAGVLPAH